MKGLTFIETIFVASITAIINSLLITYLQRRNEQIKFLRDKLIDRYSEFVAAASAELDRANMQAATALSGREDQDYTDLVQSTHQLTRSNRAQLIRLSLQIRLLEQDDSLNNQAQELSKNQPLMIFILPPRWSDGLYREQFNKFQSEISAFDHNLSKLVIDIQNKYAESAKKSFFNILLSRAEDLLSRLIRR